MQVKKQKLERDIEEWTGSKLRMEYVKAVYCHLVYFMCRVHHSNTRLGEFKLELRLLGEISTTSDMQMIIF